jgi:hypothetical protein
MAEKFSDGDIVEILNDYTFSNGYKIKKGDFHRVACCGEELGGEDNLRLVIKCEDFKKLINVK